MRGLAPTAMRRPISRVRSFTLTSMMFMMPMPPTTRLTSAMPASSDVSVRGALLLRGGDLPEVPHGEVVRLPRPQPVLRPQQRVISFSTASVPALGRAPTKRVPSRNWPSPPCRRARKVESGTKTTSSWSEPKSDGPFRAATPTTSKGTLSTRTSCPTGFAYAPKRFSATVAPSTATLAPRATSSGPKKVPRPTDQLRSLNNAGVVPWAAEAQFCPSATSCTGLTRTGATDSTSGSCCSMAARSSKVRVGCDPAPPRTPPVWLEPERTMSRLVPMDSKVCCTRARAPAPMDVIATTAATPITTPRAVRIERILLRSRARTATSTI